MSVTSGCIIPLTTYHAANWHPTLRLVVLYQASVVVYGLYWCLVTVDATVSRSQARGELNCDRRVSMFNVSTVSTWWADDRQRCVDLILTINAAR